MTDNSDISINVNTPTVETKNHVSWRDVREIPGIVNNLNPSYGSLVPTNQAGTYQNSNTPYGLLIRSNGTGISTGTYGNIPYIISFSTEYDNGSEIEPLTYEIELNNHCAEPDEIGQNCSICREDILEDDVLTKIGCNHLFHYLCLDEWLDHNNTCPLCREVVSESL